MDAKVKTNALGMTVGLDESDYPTEELSTIGRDKLGLDWSTVLKRTFEAYIRGERPNMYGEWIEW